MLMIATAPPEIWTDQNKIPSSLNGFWKWPFQKTILSKYPHKNRGYFPFKLLKIIRGHSCSRMDRSQHIENNRISGENILLPPSEGGGGR